jgi:hypothetical protein
MIDRPIRLLYELENTLFPTILIWNFQHISYNTISPNDLRHLSGPLERCDNFRQSMKIASLDLTQDFICLFRTCKEIIRERASTFCTKKFRTITALAS